MNKVRSSVSYEVGLSKQIIRTKRKMIATKAMVMMLKVMRILSVLTIPVEVWSGSSFQVGTDLFDKFLIFLTGYPWWPCMVDYCPEVEETFWIDVDVNPNEAAQYHVV